jgi:anti-anti-sigma factor
MTDSESSREQLPELGEPEELALVTVAEHGGALVVTISGEVDISNIDRVADVIQGLPNSEEGMVVDLTGAVYLDSSAVSLLHDLARRLRNRAQRLVVVSPPHKPPRRVLELTALYLNAPLADDLEAGFTMLGDTSLR